MIISSSGTTVPGSPIRPEYLKANVYLPPAFVAHHPDLHNHIIDIVQQYIETIGVRTVTMWTQRARHDLKYSLTQRGNPHQNAVFNAIPNPEPNSAHYTFLGQPFRIIQDPSTTSVQPPSPDSSVASYDFGEDPDPITLLNIDLQEKNLELQDRIDGLQQVITDLEQQVDFSNVRNSSLSASLQRAKDQIVSLEGRVQRFMAAERITSTPSAPVSTPVRNVAHVTPPSLRYALPRPVLRSPGLHAPVTPSRHHGTTSASRLQLGNSTVSRSVSAIDGSSADDLASLYDPLLPHYINLLNLHHIAAPLDLIFKYTPAGNRTQELLKLGIDEDMCDALAKAMILDSREAQ